MNIVVLAGGTSTERDISIMTSVKVCESLRRNGHNANIIDVFLIISFCIMVSGFSAFIYQEFNINIIIGFIFMLICSYCAFKRRATGIIKINNILIPIIIFIIFFIVIKKVNLYELNFIEGLNGEVYNISNFINNCRIENFKFLIFSILYANYNLLTIIPIVVTMSNVTKNKKEIKYISIICSIIIFILSMSIFSILSQSNFNITNLEMPVVFIVGRYGIFYKYIYCLVVGIAIFTTAISVGYGYLQNYENNKEKYNKKIILLILCSIIAIPIGFSKLIELLYPIFGGIGLVQSICDKEKKKRYLKNIFSFYIMVSQEGVEPPTPGLEGLCSIQLSY